MNKRTKEYQNQKTFETYQEIKHKQRVLILILIQDCQNQQKKNKNDACQIMLFSKSDKAFLIFQV